MRKHLIVLASIFVVAGAANAQTPATSSATAKAQTAAPSASSAPASSRAETWTKKQWDAAQKQWAKDKTRWSDCQKQSGEKHLDGRKSWSFLYTCMTS
jgi:hypothetical protein